MAIFKVEAYGDTMYIEAPNQADAEVQLTNALGDIPPSLLSWSTVESLPEGEELL